MKKPDSSKINSSALQILLEYYKPNDRGKLKQILERYVCNNSTGDYLYNEDVMITFGLRNRGEIENFVEQIKSVQIPILITEGPKGMVNNAKTIMDCQTIKGTEGDEHYWLDFSSFIIKFIKGDSDIYIIKDKLSNSQIGDPAYKQIAYSSDTVAKYYGTDKKSFEKFIVDARKHISVIQNGHDYYLTNPSVHSLYKDYPNLKKDLKKARDSRSKKIEEAIATFEDNIKEMDGDEFVYVYGEEKDAENYNKGKKTLLKIGAASYNPSTRINHQRTGNPRKLINHILFSCPKCTDLETAMHKKLSEHQVKAGGGSEWFNVTRAEVMSAYIKCRDEFNAEKTGT